MKQFVFFTLLFFGLLFSSVSTAQLILTEASSRNATLYAEDNKDYSDFIEVLNNSAAVINLSGWYLTDDAAQPTKWPFFAQTLAANQRTVVFADEQNSFGWWNTFQHTNFKISNAGETIYLVNSSGIIADSLVISKMETNQSVGKINGTNAGQVFFNVTTPNAVNAATYYNTIAGTPTINLPGGFYTTTIAVNANCPASQTAVYTLNGEMPTELSTVFPASINISNTQVLKVRCKGTGYMLGNIKTETFLFNENTTLPVISVSTDSANLWDFNTGIWVDGPNVAQWQGANYFKGWRRAAKMEYFENGLKQFGKDVAIINEGGSSISYPKHSFRMNFVHSTMGNDKLNYTVFENEKPQIQSFKNLRLRNGGNVYGIPSANGGGGILFHDAVMQSLTKNLNLTYEAYKPAIVYVNGKFWGLYELREKVDDYFYKTNANATESGVRESNGGWPVDQYLQWDAVIDTLYNATNKNTDAYYNANNLNFDYKNVIDYFSSQIHFFNTDWVTINYTNNIKMWLDTSSTSDKRYRYTLHDLDYSFCNAYPNDNLMDVVVNTGALTAHTKLFRSFLQNKKFKKDFINRYADLVNYYFHADTVHKVYDVAQAAVQNEIARECTQWPTNTTAQWANKFNLIRNCADTRNVASRNELDSILLNKGGQVNITIDAFPAGAGAVKVSTLQPVALPWTGIYFKANEVPMQAVANAGYVFDHWQTNPASIFSVDTSISIDTFFTQNANVTAVFKPENNLNVSNIGAENYVQISPIPATENIQIYFSNALQKQQVALSVSDIFGKEVLKKSVNTFHQYYCDLNIAQLSAGQYFLTSKNMKGLSVVSKFIKL